MNNSKIIFVTVLVLTLLVGGSLGFLIGERTTLLATRGYHLKKQAQRVPDLKTRFAKHLVRRDCQKKLQQKKGEVFLHVLSKKCDLTPKQQEEIKNIMQSKRPQIQNLRKDLKDKLQRIKEKTEEEIKEILTEKQKEEFESLKEGIAQRHKMKRSFWR